jgi:magnesium transporter
MQVKYINKALQRFDSTQVIPVQFVMFTLSVIVGSAVLYRDFEQTTPQRAGKFVWGCLLTFFGVFLITSGRSVGDDEYDEGMVEEGAETISLAQQEVNAEENDYPGDSSNYKARRILTILENGDAAHDEESRRPSLTSFISTPSRPQTPRAHSSTSRPSSICLTSTVDASHIALRESSPLLANPWKSPQDDLFAIQQNSSTHSVTTPSSTILYETQTQPLSSVSRPPITRASKGSISQTDVEQNYTTDPPQADSARPTTPARHSIAHSMLPGPFISPLSSPLSAIVADTARRGFDSTFRKQSLRRPRLRIGRSKSIPQGHDPETSPEVLRSSSPLKNHNGDTEHILSKSLSASNGIGQTDLSKRSRAKSLGHAFGDFWRGKILKRDEGESSGGA